MNGTVEDSRQGHCMLPGGADAPARICRNQIKAKRTDVRWQHGVCLNEQAHR